MSDLSCVTAVIPSYNENHDNLRKLEESLSYLGIEVIIVDDGSKEPYPNAVKHYCNMGYGQALMTGIIKATRPIIVTLDGDGQHRMEDVVNLKNVWDMIDVDMIIGARRLDYEKPLRMWGRKILNLIASFFTGRFLPDLNSGMRIFRRDVAMNYFPILCKTFSFTTSITMSFFCDNYKVEWFPIKVSERPYGKSHVKVIKDGLVTLWYIIWIGSALRTRRIRAWLRKHL